MILAQMFSTFPDGWPGVGLMLLRGAAGAVLFSQGITYFRENHAPSFVATLVVSVAIAFGVLLLMGLLTRFAAVAAALVGVSSLFSLFPGSNAGSSQSHMTLALSAVIAASLICLGPGALSLDSRFFGRREVIIPPTSSSRTAGSRSTT